MHRINIFSGMGRLYYILGYDLALNEWPVQYDFLLQATAIVVCQSCDFKVLLM